MINKSYHHALSFSIGLHIIILFVLLLGDFSTENKPVTPAAKMAPIQAVVVDKSKVDQLVKKIRNKKSADQAAEKKRLRDAQNKLDQAQSNRKKEEARIKKLELERKAKINEKKKADAAAAKSKLAAKAAETKRKKQEAEQKAAEKSAAQAKAKRQKEEKAAADAKAKRQKEEKIAQEKAKQKALIEKNRKIAEEKRKKEEAFKRAEQEKMLAQQMEQEMASRQHARSQQVMSEVDRYGALITATIKRLLLTDRSSMENKSCKLTISLAPSGFVTNVVITGGDPGVCQAAKTATYKAGTLPVSKDPEVFKELKKLNVTVIPEF